MSKKREISTAFKIFLTTWAFVENGLFSGLRAGWSSLVYILKQENIYAELCNTESTGNFSTRATQQTVSVTRDTNNTTVTYTSNSSTPSDTTSQGCNEQDAVYNQCFTVATATMAFSALLYGQLNYKFGIRVPRVLSVVLFVGGACCFAFIDKDLPWLMFPGLLLISSGGMSLYITNNQISYMFTTGSAAVVGLLCGALEASAIVQTIIKILYTNGISLFISYLTLAGLYSLTLISTLCFLPKDFVTSEIHSETSDIEAGTDQEKAPITRNYDSVNVARLGDSDGIMCTKGRDAFTDSGIASDIVCTSSTTTNGSDISNDLSENGSMTDGTYQRIPKKLTNSSINRATDEHQQINQLHDLSSLEQEQSQTGAEMLIEKQQRDMQVTDVMFAASYKNKSQKNCKNASDEIKTTSNSPIRKGVSKERTLLKCLLTKTFLLYLFWAVAVQIILSMSLGTFNPWLEYVTNNDTSKVSELTDILFYSMLGSPVLALLFGVGMDALNRPKSGDTKPAAVRTLHTATISLSVTSILGVLVCGLFMTCNNDIVIGTSVALVVFRTGLYSCGTAFLRIMYPTNYFGILCGIMAVLSGSISYVQYPLFLWVQDRNQAWMEVFGFLGIIGIVSLVQPAYLYWKSRSFIKDFDSDKKNDTTSDRLKAESSDIQEAD